jgi:dGTPase
MCQAPPAFGLPEESMRSQNNFYSSFDLETYGRRRKDKYRTPFQVDRDRIVHSYAFRRLQSKTQVFKPGEYDFYRTRLTHTIEVAQIGRSICNYLRETSEFLKSNFYIDPDLVEAVCLAHDLGHPPFGHAGERTLNELMDSYGGFEGNAQTLRLLSETIWSDPTNEARQGMKPTRALLDGVLKYKITRSETEGGKFVYDDQRKYLAFVQPGANQKERAHKSIECQIMEWSDDIAYSVADIVDGVRARFITPQRLRSWRGEGYADHIVSELMKALRAQSLNEFAARKIGEFVEGCYLKESEHAGGKVSSKRHRYDLKVRPSRKAEQRCLNLIAVDLVFKSPEIQQLEYKSQEMLKTLFRILSKGYLDGLSSKHHLLPKDVEHGLEQAINRGKKARILCDHISGMSDEYAARTYRRLTDPEFGSIFDLV